MQRLYIIKHVRPALEGDALEDRQHGQSEVVKIRDTEVRALPELLAAVIVGFVPRALVASGTAWYRIVHYLVCDIKENRIFNPGGLTAVDRT